MVWKICSSSRLLIQALLKPFRVITNHLSFQRKRVPIGCSTKVDVRACLLRWWKCQYNSSSKCCSFGIINNCIHCKASLTGRPTCQKWLSMNPIHGLCNCLKGQSGTKEQKHGGESYFHRFSCLFSKSLKVKLPGSLACTMYIVILKLAIPNKLQTSSCQMTIKYSGQYKSMTIQTKRKLCHFIKRLHVGKWHHALFLQIT